ncbi:hypothetical protein [Chitinimonas sp.]|uniref:hypothetical protein n=1 Tax=Chitinimonas sp. TaxID=1934313 RepID=UPI0035B4D759
MLDHPEIINRVTDGMAQAFGQFVGIVFGLLIGVGGVLSCGNGIHIGALKMRKGRDFTGKSAFAL